MADDASYATFLNRANQDPASGGSNKPDSTSQARSQFDPSDSKSLSSAFPKALQSLPDTTYTSDTDSPFEPTFLSYASHELPDVKQFKQVLGVKYDDSNVEVLSVEEWDPKGQYKDIVQKVEDAGSEVRSGRQGNEEGSVKVYRVEKGTRVEYYVLTVGERSLIGVVAKAVES